MKATRTSVYNCRMGEEERHLINSAWFLLIRVDLFMCSNYHERISEIFAVAVTAIYSESENPPFDGN